jgi:fibronectin-binding autotransporter adhesin
MTTKYVRTAGGLNNAAATYCLTSGGTETTTVPTASDDLILDANSGAFTVQTTLSVRSLDANAYTNSLTLNAGLAIGTSTNQASNIALRLGASLTVVGPVSSVIDFVSTSGTQNTITTNGNQLRAIQFNGSGGSWQLQDNVTIQGVFLFQAGTLSTNSKSITMAQFASFGGGGQTYFSLIMNAGGTYTITGANTFGTLNRTGTTNPTDGLNILANQTITSGLTLAGNSVTNRLLVASNTPGNAFTITSAANTISYCDFRDITGAGAGSWDLHSITGLSGDCGGNSGITFTAATTQTWTGLTTGGNWSDASKWTSRVPLPQDPCILGVAFVGQQTIVSDMPRSGASIDWTGMTFTVGQPIWSKSNAFTVYGNVIMARSVAQQ